MTLCGCKLLPWLPGRSLFTQRAISLTTVWSGDRVCLAEFSVYFRPTRSSGTPRGVPCPSAAPSYKSPQAWIFSEVPWGKPSRLPPHHPVPSLSCIPGFSPRCGIHVRIMLSTLRLPGLWHCFLLLGLGAGQSLSRIWLFATPWTAAHQASLSIGNSRRLLKLMSIESVIPSNISSSVVPFSSHLQSFPASGSFPMSQLFTSGGQSIGVSASASVLPMNIQDWFPLGLPHQFSFFALSYFFCKGPPQPEYSNNLGTNIFPSHSHRLK